MQEQLKFFIAYNVDESVSFAYYDNPVSVLIKAIAMALFLYTLIQFISQRALTF
jgi:hypothetical protein